MFSEWVHCMLIVVISLTKDHDKNGIKVCDITRNYNIPSALISAAVQRRVQEELIILALESRFLLSEKEGKTICI